MWILPDRRYDSYIRGFHHKVLRFDTDTDAAVIIKVKASEANTLLDDKQITGSVELDTTRDREACGY